MDNFNKEHTVRHDMTMDTRTSSFPGTEGMEISLALPDSVLQMCACHPLQSLTGTHMSVLVGPMSVHLPLLSSSKNGIEVVLGFALGYPQSSGSQTTLLEVTTGTDLPLNLFKTLFSDSLFSLCISLFCIFSATHFFLYISHLCLF
ncbi:hypothetical protein EXN66_Car011186 [Channa argus]|uniref:Uncharacterized protein n=1 Tax=Channa argus TaxID=215402 RepID=A0A6G1PYU9_CHAAH|nr:hypothetical protein EXN66_Car011186 [Channa argus]